MSAKERVACMKAIIMPRVIHKGLQRHAHKHRSSYQPFALWQVQPSVARPELAMNGSGVAMWLSSPFLEHKYTAA